MSGNGAPQRSGFAGLWARGMLWAFPAYLLVCTGGFGVVVAIGMAGEGISYSVADYKDVVFAALVWGPLLFATTFWLMVPILGLLFAAGAVVVRANRAAR